MKHRFFTFFLAVLMLLSAIPAAATEVTEPTQVERAPGYCGEAIMWDYTDGVLTLTGVGAMDDFPEGTPWEEYRSDIKKAVISGGITYVGARSFYDCDNLTEVEFGKDVYEIGEQAFFSCDALTVIHLPAAFKVFGPSSFMGCTRLKEIHCEGKFPSFRQNCLWDTYATIYFPAERPWNVKNIRDLEEAFKGRIEFLASDGTDPYVPTEPTEATEAPTEAPTEVTEAPTEAPTTVPPTTEAPTEEVTEPVPTETEDITEVPTEEVTQAPTEPVSAEKGGSGKAGYIIIGAVAVFLLLGILVFGGGRKKGKYSR